MAGASPARRAAYEVLLRVDWDPGETTGTRFAHTKIPGQEPLHSEAISAAVLNQLSDGRQLLRGNSLFGPDRTSCLILEVWHDSGRPLEVCYAELVMIGSAEAQSNKINPADATTIKPGTNTSFGALKQIDAGVLNVGYAHCRHIQPHGRQSS